MGNFNRGGRSDSGRSFGRGGFGGNRGFGSDRGEVTMHNAVCDKCGKDCQVPFKPTGAKPVYCNDCFRTMGGAEGKRNDDRAPRRDFENRSESRPDNRSEIRNDSTAQNEIQFTKINRKLDKIMEMLAGKPAVKKENKNKEHAPQEKAPVKTEELEIPTIHVEENVPADFTPIAPENE
jgi:CxxC-x17-CxxC domain-containing protein